MIFVSVGSQKFQFDRLLKKIDDLIEDGTINEKVFAQIGTSNYKPKNYDFADFLDRRSFGDMVDKCSLLITHAGTGVIVGAVKKGKMVVAVPRLAKYKEHVDDHQIQLLKQFDDLNLIESCYELNELGDKISNISNKKFDKYVSNTDEILDSIREFIDKE